MEKPSAAVRVTKTLAKTKGGSKMNRSRKQTILLVSLLVMGLCVLPAQAAKKEVTFWVVSDTPVQTPNFGHYAAATSGFKDLLMIAR